jgi:hypothetical protein
MHVVRYSMHIIIKGRREAKRVSNSRSRWNGANSRANGFGSSCYYSLCCCYEYEVFLSSSSGHLNNSSCWKDRTSTAQQRKEKRLCWLDAGKDKPRTLLGTCTDPFFSIFYFVNYANPSLLLLLFYWIHSWIQPTDPAAAQQRQSEK